MKYEAGGVRRTPQLQYVTRCDTTGVRRSPRTRAVIWQVSAYARIQKILPIISAILIRIAP